MKEIKLAYLRARNLGELLALSGEQFVGACYLTLLGRDPDSEGLQHHLERLALGVDRLEIIGAFVASPECRHYGAKVPGLAEALIKAQIARHAGAFAAMGLQHDMSSLVGYLDLIPPPGRGEAAGSAVPAAFPKMVHRREGSAIIVVPRDGNAPGLATGKSLWYDLTDLFRGSARPHAQIRAELELAGLLQRARPDLRFLIEVENRLLEVSGAQIDWLFAEDFAADAFAAAYLVTDSGGARTLEALSPLSAADLHPCDDGDMVIGWASVGKKIDRILAREGDDTAGIQLCHILSDAHVSAGASAANDRLKRYLWWLSSNSALLLFTDEAESAAVSALQKAERWPSPPHLVLDGLGLLPRIDDDSSREVVEGLGVAPPFALYSGSFAPASNLETLYRAWMLAREIDPGKVPRLVLCGLPDDRRGDLIEAMSVDPRLAGELIVLKPADRERAALYRAASFVVIPAIDEEADRTLQEALSQGKACVVAESGKSERPAQSAVSYVHPVDTRAWANAILRLASSPSLIAEREADIAAGWTPRLPEDGVRRLARALESGARRDGVAGISRTNAPPAVKPTIWMDLTLTFMEWGGHITGIVRAELTFAYYLKKLAPETRYFAFVRGEPGYFFEIEGAYLDWLFDALDLSDAYRLFNDFWKDREANGIAYRDPFRATNGPVPGHPAYLGSFPPNSVVFFAAIDQDGTGTLSRCRAVLDIVHDEQASMTSQLIYDLTPFLMPQVHHEYTVRGYTPFVEFVSDHFDHLLFGGRTSQRDCLRIQQAAGWGTPPNDFVEFGSDIALAGESALPPLERDRSIDTEKEILERLGITGAFVITVGSLEPRKNHEVLYKAYLELLERGSLKDDLQMVFIGKRGWKIDDLLATIAADERVRGKLLILSPTDDELEALYFQCRFTLLPSFYEGWSLTLPESLSYGKFCLVSDVDPLRETGGDLAEYIHPLDTMAWADRIEHYANHPDEVARWEARIRRGWHPRTWRESAQMLIERLHAAHAERYPY